MRNSRLVRVLILSAVFVVLFLLTLVLGKWVQSALEGTRLGWVSNLPGWTCLLIFVPWVLVLLSLLIAAERTVLWFCHAAFWEAISYLLLLFVAMPLKYFAELPEAVTYVGWLHGVLFIAYVVLLLAAWMQEGWNAKRVGWYFLASLLPLVPFWVEVRLKREFALRESDNYQV